MTPTIDLDAERFPVGSALRPGAGKTLRPFGVSVARPQPHFENQRELVSLDPDSQIGYFGDRPLRDMVMSGTTCSVESDGKDVISLDWMTDDK
ncbi:hypothetical protein ACFVWG_18465 [Kribbella sp. NPDC058245]|uniref:hypothetical protein n=1 Tax=Kribbella sp. NPDC058245 TaxID=3346399 RepID=UPI0036ED1F31